MCSKIPSIYKQFLNCVPSGRAGLGSIGTHCCPRTDSPHPCLGPFPSTSLSPVPKQRNVSHRWLYVPQLLAGHSSLRCKAGPVCDLQRCWKVPRAKADGACARAVTHLRIAERAKSASTQEKKNSHRLGQTTYLCSSLVMLSLSPSSPCRLATQAFHICFSLHS